MENLVALTRENIQQIVDTSNQKLVALFFWAQQSPESTQLLSTFKELVADKPEQILLASVDCETQIEIASYFQIQSVPTMLLLHKGQPVDGFAGVQEKEHIRTLLTKHLPAQWELDLSQAKSLLAEGDKNSALILLKSAYTENNCAEVVLTYADACLQCGEISTAKTLLSEIKLADQNADYERLQSQLKLAEEAADTPEIRELQNKLTAEPNNYEVIEQLANALHQTQRNEEALELLFDCLKKDLNSDNGKIKQQFMTILSALGQANTVASSYRRKLYSLLY